MVKVKILYFDCKNFYFEIDREDDFRRKCPSKENKKAPIVGLRLPLTNYFLMETQIKSMFKYKI